MTQLTTETFDANARAALGNAQLRGAALREMTFLTDRAYGRLAEYLSLVARDRPETA